MATKTRSEANALIGAPILPCRDESLNPDPCPEALPASAGAVIVPAFNMIDEGDSTQQSLAQVISKVYGIKVGFHGMFKGFLASMRMTDVAEVSGFAFVLTWSCKTNSADIYRKEANTYHLEAWNQIILNSKPPIPETPLSPYVPLSLLLEHAAGYNGENVKKVSP